MDWLVTLPTPEDEDHGYRAFLDGVDGIVMGANSFRAVLGFPSWPYDKPVVVMSQSLGPDDVPEGLRGRVRVIYGPPRAILARLGAEGMKRVYLDGGQLVSSFLREGLVQRIIITRVPVLLGAGIPLFGDTGPQYLLHLETRSWPHGFVQSVYQVTP